MSTIYMQEDVEDAPPGHMPLPGTDLELVFTRAGGAAVVHVNKSGIMICRVRLDCAKQELTGDELVRFSRFAPDFVFKVGDMLSALTRGGRQ